MRNIFPWSKQAEFKSIPRNLQMPSKGSNEYNTEVYTNKHSIHAERKKTANNSNSSYNLSSLLIYDLQSED